MTFENTINAPKEKVWQILWNDATYRQWTTPFCEGSYAETDNWKEGSKVLFLSPGGSGMVSKVAVNKYAEFMSFEHLGEVKDGVEDTTSDRVLHWAGAHENYTLTETDGVTKLLVALDANDEFKAYFEKTWPLAMENIIALAEDKPVKNTAPQKYAEPKIANNSNQKIVHFLWYDGQAEEAANFYCGIFKNATINSILPGPGGKAFSVTFQLENKTFMP